MARGWESKSVESQQDAKAERGAAASRPSTPEDRVRLQKIRSLELTRSRILEQLALTPVSPRRSALESALAEIENAIAALGPAGEARR